MMQWENKTPPTWRDTAAVKRIYETRTTIDMFNTWADIIVVDFWGRTSQYIDPNSAEGQEILAWLRKESNDEL